MHVQDSAASKAPKGAFGVSGARGAQRPAGPARRRPAGPGLRALPVVVVRGGRRGGFLRTEPDHLLAAVQTHGVVHDHVRDVVAWTTVEDVGLVVVRQRMKDVV